MKSLSNPLRYSPHRREYACNQRRRRQLLRIELLEDRRVLDGDMHGPAGVDVPFGVFTEEEVRALESAPFDSSLSTQTPPNFGKTDLNSVTFVLDFKEPGQANTSDIFGNVISTFDIGAYGFAANQFNVVANAILAEVNQDYFSELVGTVAGPPGQELDINFIIGDIGTAPVGYSEYYYIQIGSGVSGPGVGALGVAGGSVVRNTAGSGPNFGIQVGNVVGSVFTNAIQGLGGLSPGNALSSGNLQFTTNAISGTTSHEIAHTLSLSHINKQNSVQPTSGASPVMGTGAIDLPNQDRILDREFSLSGFDGQNGNAPRQHVQQLVNAVGLTNEGDDHGNSSAQATQVAVPSSTAGSIEQGNDEDYFRFNAGVGGQYTFATTLGTNSDTTLTLFDTNGTTQLAFDDDGGPGLASLINWVAPANGTYFLRVRSFSATGTGTYTLGVSVIDDHGNTAPTATPAPVPSSTAGDINYGNDVDYFSVIATGGASYTFSTTLGTNTDTTLTLYDTNGNTQLAFDDDGGPGLASLINWTAPATGTYFLAVRSFSSSGTGTYTLATSVVDDHGNSAIDASSVAVPSSTPGNIEVINDLDFFSFAAVSGIEYTIATTLLTNTDTTLTLYGTDGTTSLAFDDDGGPGLASLITWTAPASGTYFVQARSFSTGVGTYSLQIDGAGDTIPPNAPVMTLNNDTGTNTDFVTWDGSYTVVPAETGGTMEYSIDGATWSASQPTAVEGLNTMFARQIDGAGNVGAIGSLSFTLDTIAATVTGMFITSSSWSTAFIDTVDGGGPGAGNGIGVAHVAGMLPLPWVDVQQIVVQFSEDVVGISGANIEVRDSIGLLPVGSLAYDATTFRATIQLGVNLSFHKVRVAIRDALTDVAGNALDGDSSGAAGGVYNTRFDVLAGDANGDGRVLTSDLSSFASNFNQQAGQAAYNPRMDWNTDDRVSTNDLGVFAGAFNRSLQNLSEPGNPFSDNGSGGSGSFAGLSDSFFGGLGDDDDEKDEFAWLK